MKCFVCRSHCDETVIPDPVSKKVIERMRNSDRSVYRAVVSYNPVVAYVCSKCTASQVVLGSWVRGLENERQN